MHSYTRSASIAVTVFGALLNLALAVQVITASWTTKWEPESEWEASSDTWRVDVVMVIWVICCAHLTLAATVSFVGFIGILKRNSSLVRIYRDYSVVNFSFWTFVTIIATYAVFHAPARAATCEELSHHSEFLQNLMDMGLNLENCERWLERAGLAFVILMSVLLVIRLHCLLAVNNLYYQLIRHAQFSSRTPARLRLEDSHTARRIYLLPPSDEEAQICDSVQLVYAPIPIDSVPKHLWDTATEAWVSCSAPLSADIDFHSRPRSESHAHPCEQQEQQQQNLDPHGHRRHSYAHSNSHRHSRSSSAAQTGTIRLPIRPDEGLLPTYDSVSKS